MREKIRKFIADSFLFSERAVKDDEPLFESGIIDSLGLIKLLSFLEREFGITLTMKQITIENFNTLDKIVSVVEKRSKKEPGERGG